MGKPVTCTNTDKLTEWGKREGGRDTENMGTRNMKPTGCWWPGHKGGGKRAEALTIRGTVMNRTIRHLCPWCDRILILWYFFSYSAGDWFQELGYTQQVLFWVPSALFCVSVNSPVLDFNQLSCPIPFLIYILTVPPLRACYLHVTHEALELDSLQQLTSLWPPTNALICLRLPPFPVQWSNNNMYLIGLLFILNNLAHAKCLEMYLI